MFNTYSFSNSSSIWPNESWKRLKFWSDQIKIFVLLTGISICFRSYVKLHTVCLWPWKSLINQPPILSSHFFLFLKVIWSDKKTSRELWLADSAFSHKCVTKIELYQVTSNMQLPCSTSSGVPLCKFAYGSAAQFRQIFIIILKSALQRENRPNGILSLHSPHFKTRKELNHAYS